MTENSPGIILRTRPLTETSLIIHWLTRDFGRLATVAKGARRPKSSFAGKLDLFYLADISFQRSRRSELHQLREVSLLENHAHIRNEMEWLQQASLAAALVEQTTELESPIPEIFALTRDFLKQLTLQPPLPHLLHAFEIKLLAELGLQPDMEETGLGPDARRILQMLLEGEWPVLSRLKTTPAQADAISGFLHRFMVFHLGRAPKGRKP
jgi:DNA repair protein RecO (recombination protein O)